MTMTMRMMRMKKKKSKFTNRKLQFRKNKMTRLMTMTAMTPK